MSEYLVLRVLERELRVRGLLDSAQRIVVAVSGGPDSVALLVGLHRVAAAASADLHLHVAHLDHGTRDAEGRADAEFVRQIADALGVPSTIEALEPGALNDHEGLGFEAIARRERYFFLERVASLNGATHVVTGHTRDDQVETLLMRLVRGTGVRGLRGILRDRGLLPGSRVTLLRPLLDVRRSEVLEFLREADQEYRVDATNLEERALRNRIRHRVLPLMQQVTGRDPVPSMARLADHASALWDFAEGCARDWLDRHAHRYSDCLECSARELRLVHVGLRPVVLALALMQMRGSLTRIETHHFDALLDLVEIGKDATVGLPLGILVERRGELIRVRVPEKPAAPFGSVELPVPGTARLPAMGFSIEVEVLENSPGLLEKFVESRRPGEVMIDAQAAGKQLFLRCAREDEAFQPLGLGRGHRLRKYLSQRKVPRGLRPSLPLVATPSHVVWVVGYDIDERVRISPHSRLLYWLKATWDDPRFRPFPDGVAPASGDDC